MARIAIGGFLHETNCFVPMRTDYDYYARGGAFPPLARRQEVIERTRGTPCGLAGFLDTIDAAHALVPLIWGHAGAGGYVTDDAFERIVGEMIGMLSQAMPVDAVYLDLHGAMCSLTHEDAEGELLRRARATVGPDVPVVISLDYHANVTEAMARLTDGMAIYLTYPHIDRQGTGARAARILQRVLDEGPPGGRAIRRLPFLLPLNFQCTLVGPSDGIVAASVEGEGGAVLDLCYAAGFPPSDLRECGPAVICHARDQATADAAADALAQRVLDSEGAFAEPMLDPDDAVRQAMAIASDAERPVILADTQDNPGCGGTGDTTGLLEALVRHDARDAALGVMWDPEAAAAAHAAGVGAEIDIALGGKFGPEGVAPFKARYRVAALDAGKFLATGACIGGQRVDIGPTAVLGIGGVEIVVGSVRIQAYDQGLFRHIGIDPSDKKILALKSTCHFRADFDPIAEKVLIVLAPGAHIVDAARYPFQYLRPGVRLAPNGPEYQPEGISP